MENPGNFNEPPSRPKNFEEAFAQKIALETAAEKPPANSSDKKVRLIVIIISFSLIILGMLAYLIFFMKSSPLYYFWSAEEKDQVSREATPVDSPDNSPAESAANSASKNPVKKFYSTLSGEEISDESLNSSPTFCVQVPNGVDGARPQAGLDDAKVVFEAIAEAGITRFAAIFQNPTVTAIGPIRSLRIYYYDWDVPFNCTVVHSGGAPDAIAALNSSTSLHNLDESLTYMWRSNSNGTLNRLWNNLFTSSENLKKFSTDKSYLSSDIKSFAHFTPDEEKLEKINAQIVEKLDIDEPAAGDTKTLSPKVTKISLNIGNMPTFNPVYTYNPEKNSYDRSYATGAEHLVYHCSAEVTTPETDCGEAVQLSPKVVVAMLVEERKQSDNYHEDISTLGAGDAYIFENGTVIEGTWEKASKESQIVFKDRENNEIRLNPGQVWITAIPRSYGGSVFYE